MRRERWAGSTSHWSAGAHWGTRATRLFSPGSSLELSHSSHASSPVIHSVYSPLTGGVRKPRKRSRYSSASWREVSSRRVSRTAGPALYSARSNTPLSSDPLMLFQRSYEMEPLHTTPASAAGGRAERSAPAASAASANTRKGDVVAPDSTAARASRAAARRSAARSRPVSSPVASVQPS